MAEAAQSTRRLQPATIALALAALIAIGVLLYTTLFRGNGTAATGNESVAANAMTADGQVPSVEDMIGTLVERVRRNPDDHEGWFRLGLAYKGVEDLPQSIAAFRRAMELQPRNPEYAGYLGEALLIQSTRAHRPIPPEAEQLFRRTLELQPGYPRGRFYLATIKDLRGDHRGAIDDLIALLRDPSLEPAQAQQVRDAVQVIAEASQIDVTGRLPAAPPPASTESAATAAIPGPTPDQMRAAGGMTPTQQSAMGRTMVDRLAARLRQNPRDADRWMMMMRSRMVLNEPELAGQALRDSLAAFQNDPATQARLREAAQQLGVPGG
jgi:cytochrome c-type biogenesis protein CcmH